MSEPKVYIVVARKGEYSDRSEWVCGVYWSREEAVRMAEEKFKEDRTADAIFGAWCSVCLKAEREFERISPAPTHAWMEMQVWGVGRREYMERENLGSEPEKAEADDYTVVEASIGVWGKYLPITSAAGRDLSDDDKIF